MGNNSAPDRKLVRLLELPRLIRLTIREVQKPTASALLISHIVPILATVTLHGHKEVEAQPSAINFLVAFSGASDVVARSDAIFGITCLYSHEHDASIPVVDPRKLIAAVNWPPHLQAALVSYGPTRTDVYKTLQASATFQKAISKAAQDHDFYAFVRAIGPLILEVEYSVTNGSRSRIHTQGIEKQGKQDQTISDYRSHTGSMRFRYALMLLVPEEMQMMI